MEYKAVKIIGLNGFEFFVGFESVWHDQMIHASKIGVKVEIIKTNFKYDEIVENLYKIEIYKGSINKDKLASDDQKWNLGRHIVNETKSPCFPTEGITIDMYA